MDKVFLGIVIGLVFFKIFTENLFLSIIVALVILGVLTRTGKTNQKKFIANYQFPEGLDEKILFIYPHLSKESLISVKQELKHFFEMKSAYQLDVVAMPSRVVDVAWHEFILHTKDYHRFCNRAFGHYLHHNPFSKNMDPREIKRSLQRAWVYSCKAENIRPEAPFCLPVLFSIDSTLNIPDGNEFSIENLDELTSNNSLKSNASLKCMNGSFAGLGTVTLVVSVSGGDGGDGGDGCGGGCG